MELCFLISILVLVITIILFLNKNKNLAILFLGFEITNFLLIYPLYNSYNKISQIVYSIIYGLKSLGLGQDIKLISTIELSNVFNYVYVITLYVLAFVGPIITAGILISLISKTYSYFKLLNSKNKDIHIFNEMNERTECISKSIKSKNNLIIFCNSSAKSNSNNIMIKEEINKFNIKKFNKSITYYYFSDNEEENVKNTLEIINKNIDKQIKIYLLCYKEENILIIDSAIRKNMKSNIKVEIIDEVERETLRVLDETPLYLKSTNNEISVLIVGKNDYAINFLKNISYCGKIIDYNLTITIVDKDIDDVKNKLMLSCKDMLKYNNINFINDDILNYSCIKELNNIKNINYSIICTDSDEENLKIGIFLRNYFLKQSKNFKGMPIINLRISDSYKKEEVDSLINNNIEFKKDISELSIDNFFNFNTFGNIYNMYSKNAIVNGPIEKLAKNIHLIYDKNDTKLKNFYSSEYNKKSSRSLAVHIKYKLFGVLGEKYNEYFINDDINKILEIYKENLDDNIIDKLTENEHIRWCNYMRSIGYQTATLKDVEAYKDITKSHINKLAKLHPALVDYNKLDDISKALNKNFKSSNIELIKNLDQVAKDIYN